MSPARRDFLKQTGLSAAALATLSSPAWAAESAGTAAESRFAAGGSSAAELLAASAEWEAQQTEPWDTSWTKKITGKHKAMFDVPEVEGGVGVMRAGIWQRQYADVLKTQPADLSTVIVIRHAGIFLAMNQEYWTTYQVGKARKLKGDDDKPMRFNPVLPEPGKEVPAGSAGLMLDRLVANGAVALGCGLAFRAVVGLVQKQDKLDAAAARTKAMSMLVPGVIMQPSGIFADVLAQECGCVFVYAV